MSRLVFSAAAEALFALSGPTAVSAGAGSGKTTALVELLLRLMDGRATGSSCAPAELVAITFTEKAADELRERVRRAVVKAAAGSAGEERRAWLLRLGELHRLGAGTIHGYCGRLLREHAPEAGLDPEFEVVDEERAFAWQGAAAREAVVAALDAGRPLARELVAAPGGGTRALSGFIVALARERATRGEEGPLPAGPDHGAAVEGARRELLRAAEALCAGRAEASGPAALTLVDLVAAALSALRPADRDGPLTPAVLGRLEAVARAASGKKGRLAALAAARDSVARAGEAFLLAAADALAAPQRAELAALLGDAERRYAARKAAARAVDFDDLLLRARSLLRGDPALRGELRGGLRAFLVDEFQDVNPVQQSIFELLCGEEGPGPGPVLVAVGDLKQSIYRFRGADVAVFTRLIRRLGAGEGRVLHLSENHRSSPALLDLVNAVSERALQPPAGEVPRDDEIAFRPEDRLLPRRPEGARPACEILVDGEGGKAAERRGREAAALAARIRQLVAGGSGLYVRERDPEGGKERVRPPRLGEVAVLFRRLTQLAPYERALREAGIPFRLARGGGFYQASEVRDVGELLAALSDPEDALALAALLRSPACAVSDGTLFLLARLGLSRLPRLSFAELDRELTALAGAEGVSRGERERLARLLAVFGELHAVRDRLRVQDLLLRAIEALDLDAALLAGPDGERRAANLEKVVALSARFAEGGGTVAEFAAHLRSMAARPPREPEAALEATDAVALLTVHQAKGLEWPVVFVPDLGSRPPAEVRQVMLDGEGRLCSALLDPAREEPLLSGSLLAAREAERRAAAAESRRLLYVALTRARDHLVLSGEGSGDTWRRLVEEALAGREDLARRVPVGEVRAFGASFEGPRPEPADPPPAPPPLPGPPTPKAVRMAVTELAEYARCPRRHLLGRVLGLPEPRPGVGSPDDDPARATARGTLAHAMLSEADLAAPPLEWMAQLRAVAARRGYDPGSPGVRRIAAEVAAFAGSPGGRRLAAAGREGRLGRELPFLLRLTGQAGGAVYLVGVLDALVRGRRGGLTVVDYKYATPRPGAAARYRLQLAAYALAAGRAHPGARVRAVLQFLRGDQRAVNLTPTAAELGRLEVEAPRLALEAARPREHSPAELGREESRCRAEGCGYVGRCFGGGGAARSGPTRA
ncbi:MAG TPA: UvrD-helicase domain-containing protein [Anaeromyxobacter sp.]|nr:UvrD-helicase domain-containing protein [Anaeromyxobacter sp.]